MMKKCLITTLLSVSLLFLQMACNSNRSVFESDSIALKETGKNATSAPTGQPASASGIAMKQSVLFLASDMLEGRGLGTHGLDEAAVYIASSFQGAGLHTLPNTNSYFQPFEMKSVEGVAPETNLKIGDKAYKLDDDFRPISISGEKSFAGEAVFVGYGITSKDYKYDDYANADVKGKIAIAWRFEPADKEGKSQFTKKDWSDNSQLQVKAKNAADHGAIALLLINPPAYKGVSKLMAFSRDFMGNSVAIPVCHLKTETGNELLKTGTSEEAAALQEQIDSHFKPKSIALKDTHITGNVALKHVTRNLKNVLAYIPGSGPTADEFVVVGGHYDHLGKGGFGSLAVKSQEIHHGADDNASGAAAVIELGKEFGYRYLNGWRPARSILFVTFTAEEEGLIGSHEFVEHPPVPLASIAAMLNLDMVGRMRDNTLFIGGSGTSISFEDILRAAEADVSIKLKDIGKGGRGPSDHMSFANKKIPVMFFFTGMHPDYHRPTDTVEKINFDGMAMIVKFSSRVVEGMITMAKGEYVAQADAHSMPMGSGSGDGERRTWLGVMPMYPEEPGNKGVRITGTLPGSPAEKAGLADGDLITSFAGKPLTSLLDLSSALVNSKPGDKVVVKVLRAEKEVKLDVVLQER